MKTVICTGKHLLYSYVGFCQFFSERFARNGTTLWCTDLAKLWCQGFFLDFFVCYVMCAYASSMYSEYVMYSMLCMLRYVMLPSCMTTHSIYGVWGACLLAWSSAKNLSFMDTTTTTRFLPLVMVVVLVVVSPLFWLTWTEINWFNNNWLQQIS